MADVDGVVDIELPLSDLEGLGTGDRSTQRRLVPLRQLALHEVHQQVVGVALDLVRIGVGVDDGLQLGGRADEELSAQPPCAFRARPPGAFRCRRRNRPSPQHQIAAGQQGLGVVEAQVLGQAQQVVLQHLFAHPHDSAQQGDVEELSDDLLDASAIGPAPPRGNADDACRATGVARNLA